MIQDVYREYLLVWFALSLAAVVAASWALWRHRARRRREGRSSSRLVIGALGAGLFVSAYCNPFVAVPVAETYMGAIKDRAQQHVRSAPESVIAACGIPSSVSESWLVYQPPWFLLWPVDVRVLIFDGEVGIAYLDD